MMKNEMYKADCIDVLKGMKENTVDLVIIDPPYEFNNGEGGGAFGSDKRFYHKEYSNLSHYEALDARKVNHRIELKRLSNGFDFATLDELCRVMKKINIYVWCSKLQLRKLLTYFEEKGCFTDVLTWHKTNPTPTCNNTYLADTEYCVFAREKGVKVYGTYHTKKKWYVTPCNKKDKDLYKHPTIKPLEIIKNLIVNSTENGGVVLDCFMGSGTTGVACKQLGRDFIGIEINETYFEIAKRRIEE